jgi:hypothetical protein
MRPNLTFKHLTDLGFRPFRHNTVIWAKRMATPFVVPTCQGPQRGEPGDYWCVGLYGRQWVSPAAVFERTYTPV